MTRDERLLKRALDVLDWAHDVFGLEKDGIAIKTALRDRLAQPEHNQKPVSRILLIDEATVELAIEALENVTKDYVENRQRTHNRAIEQLYKVFVPAPQRKPLTEKRIEELYSFWVVDCQDIVGFARAVERTVKGEA